MSYYIKYLGITDYQIIWDQMKSFTEKRESNTPNEYWVLQHNPIFTLGIAGLESHMLIKKHSIPTIYVDRGGQITYHAPGQIVIYTLIDLAQKKLSIRKLVELLEQGIINYLASKGIVASGDRKAPGVYVDGKKIASIGLKVRKNCTYHGISFNFDMDIRPFSYINVCGYQGLKVIQLKDLLKPSNSIDIDKEASVLADFVSLAIEV